MSSNFKITMDDQVFTIVFPVAPEKEFAKYRPVIPLHEDRLFEKSGRVIGLQVHWKYRAGLIRKVAGVMEMQVKVQAGRDFDVASLGGLKQQLYADFKRELAEAGYSDTAVQFEIVRINGRSWLKYQVPIIGAIEYSTSLSEKRFLTVQFACIDNTGEKSPAWYKEANSMINELTESIRVQ